MLETPGGATGVARNNVVRNSLLTLSAWAGTATYTWRDDSGAIGNRMENCEDRPGALVVSVASSASSKIIPRQRTMIHVTKAAASPQAVAAGATVPRELRGGGGGQPGRIQYRYRVCGTVTVPGLYRHTTYERVISATAGGSVFTPSLTKNGGSYSGARKPRG